jgi:hypothetical protein
LAEESFDITKQALGFIRKNKFTNLRRATHAIVPSNQGYGFNFRCQRTKTFGLAKHRAFAGGKAETVLRSQCETLPPAIKI